MANYLVSRVAIVRRMELKLTLAPRTHENHHLDDIFTRGRRKSAKAIEVATRLHSRAKLNRLKSETCGNGI